MMKKHASLILFSLMPFFSSNITVAQEEPSDKPPPRPEQSEGGFRGFGGPGPMGGEKVKILEKFDADKNGFLDSDERKSAREFLTSEEGQKLRQRSRRGPGGFGPGGPGGFRPNPEGFGPGGFGPGAFGPGGFGPGGPNGPGAREGRRGPNGEGGRGELGPGSGERPEGEARRGRRGGFGQQHEPVAPGEKVSVSDVLPSNAPLYDDNTLRTIFFNFDETDWEKALEDFHNTDVEIPVTMIVDGKEFKDVGLRFRGMSSFGMVPSGHKRSFNVSVDYVHKDQQLYGYNTLNLLNAHEDDSMIGAVLYSHIARQYMPAPKANVVRVVINGENWGVYTNMQQFNKVFLNENFQSTKGARWKVSGSPMGNSGLAYIGDDVAAYKAKYEIKSGDGGDWQALIDLCRIISTTPTDKLEQELRKVMDVDELLWFLAIDNALINCDGYWIRASDYSIYRDESGKFHVLPGDMNEAFRRPMGPGMGGFGPRGGMGRNNQRPNDSAPPPSDVAGPPEGFPFPPEGFPFPPEGFPFPPEGMPFPPEGFGPPPLGPGGMAGGSASPVDGVKLDPLVGMDDASKPLRSKVLAVPALRAQYLANVKTIASKSLDWNSIGPFIASYRSLIDAEVKADTKKLGSYEAFVKATSPELPSTTDETSEGPQFGPFARNKMSLRQFADERRDYLINYSESAN